jgi:predicted lactoylglutathione lyase
MNNKISTITLPALDLKKSLIFYRDQLGFNISEESISEAHLAFELENGLFFVLIERDEFNDFAKVVNQNIASKGNSECILTYFAGNRDEVDEILNRAKQAGVTPVAAQDKPWGYAGYFADIDGHIWEVIHNPKMYNIEVERTWN